MGMYASAVVKQAQSWLGCNEYDGSHKKIIDIYNNHKPLARGYKVKYTNPWCATFGSSVAIVLGYTDIIPLECGCGEQIELWKKIKRWVEADDHVPGPGEYIYYDWDDDGKGDNTGWPEHVGIVVEVVNGIIKVIEGNYNNAVRYREIPVNGKNIRGYGVPKYDAEPTTKEEVKPAETKTNQGECKVDLRILNNGDKGSDVKALQTLLHGYGYPCGSYGVDGNFGAATEAAVKRYQKAKKLEVDGCVGPKTWAKLLGV